VSKVAASDQSAIQVSVRDSYHMKSDLSYEGSVQLIDAPKMIFTVYHLCIKYPSNSKFVTDLKYNLRRSL